MENPIDLNYTRIIPRDLFNEAKLLKCIGRLCLLIHDRMAPVEMNFDETGEPFIIGRTQDGSLEINNLDITIKNNIYRFKTTINDKSNYPLFVETEDYCEILVFNDNGDFTKDFVEFCEGL